MGTPTSVTTSSPLTPTNRELSTPGRARRRDAVLGVVEGVIERRLLVNYRVEPDLAARVLPSGLRPHVVNGSAVVGVCLLRMGSLRPRGVPAALGLRSENAAHRVAVEWGSSSEPTHGVFIPRRDSASAVNVAVGGRLYPGEHSRASFTVEESASHLDVRMEARDGAVHAGASVEVVAELSGSSLFADLAAASAFFEGSPVGLSATRSGSALDALELRTDAWSVQACRMLDAHSSLLDASEHFPAGAAQLDSVLLMRDVAVTWVPRRRVVLA
jgi:uncharacterized protein YqjF (DUF2071 family)